MKRPLSLVALILGPCAFPASAILDTNSNGMSDPWEMMYNDGELFPSTDFPCGPQDDFDCDGWTNEEEAAAGTNPFDANPPDGLLRPHIVHIPAVLIDTDLDGIPDTISTPEAVTVSWTTIPGKQYTLFYSPDLVDWLPVPGETFISDGSPAEYDFTLAEDSKLFWRVSIEDVDSDGDGLTDAEECLFGTNPGTPETLAGYPDLWLATYFSSDLMNGGPSTIDPDSDTDGDGLTRAQEQVLKTNPTVSDNPGVVQNSIRNGDFSIPGIDGTEGNPGLNPHQKDTEPNWNYWAGLPEPFGERSWKAYTEPGGPNIEYQRLTGSTDQYVELRAHPAGNRGIKQKVGTIIGKTYLLLFDCKTRPLTEPSINNFSVTIGNENNVLIRAFEFEGLTDWATKSISFTAKNVITEIAFIVPQVAPNDTLGCFVDNVKLMPVEVDDNVFATGVDDVSITANPQDIGYQEKFWIMAPSGNASNGSACSNVMKFIIPFNPSTELEISYPQGTLAPATPTPGTVTLCSTGADCAWHGVSSTTTEAPAVVWGIGASGQTKTAVDLPIAVKTMKNRTVKVAVYLVAELKSDGTTVPPNELMIPNKAQLEQYLNELFAYQINTWFQVEFMPATKNVDFGGVLNQGTDTEHSADQTAVIDAFGGLKSGSDLHLFLVGASSLIAQDAKGFTCSEKATSWVFASRNGAYNDPDDLMTTIGHEVGHVFFGQGHPDKKSPYQGAAPLEGTDRSKRLMFSSSDADSRLIVKKEWDKADAWLVTKPNGDN